MMENATIIGFKITLSFFICGAAFFGSLYCANIIMPDFLGFANNLIANAFLASVGIILYMVCVFIILVFIGIVVYFIEG